MRKTLIKQWWESWVIKLIWTYPRASSESSDKPIHNTVFTMVFRSLAILALAVLPTALAQISADFEGGWDQTTWPIYAPDCNQVRSMFASKTLFTRVISISRTVTIALCSCPSGSLLNEKLIRKLGRFRLTWYHNCTQWQELYEGFESRRLLWTYLLWNNKSTKRRCLCSGLVVSVRRVLCWCMHYEYMTLKHSSV